MAALRCISWVDTPHFLAKNQQDLGNILHTSSPVSEVSSISIHKMQVDIFSTSNFQAGLICVANRSAQVQFTQ
jgi:hypothetical protein